MKIAKVQASVHAFKTTLPIVGKPAGDSIRVICEIETEDGLVGVGMASRFLCHGVAASVNRHLGPAIVGFDPRDLEKIHARLHKLVSERGQTLGINQSALSCVDLALWDLIGKASERSVAQLLGGHRDAADVYVTFGFGAFDRDQLVEVARDLIQRVLQEDDPLEKAEILRELDRGAEGDVERRLADAGHLKGAVRAEDVLAELRGGLCAAPAG